MPRFFTLQQAENVLPNVASAIREAISRKAEYDAETAEWNRFSQRVALLGGVRVDPADAAERNNRRQAAAHALKAAIDQIQAFGCLVKDLEIGLIDFPTLFQGEEVYLCWKLGEPAIQFWHGVSEGFRGRKPIDAHFLEEHRGEIPK